TLFCDALPPTTSGRHVAGLAADVGFVHFDVAAELPAAVGVVLHGEPNALQHEPRGLLRNANRARDLVAADAVLAVGTHPHRRQPLVEAEGAVFKDGSSLQGELALLVAGLALPSVARCHEVHLVAAAGRAGDPVRPTASDKELPAVVGISEVLDGFEKGFRC